jgi:hypothetical protein
VIVGFEAGALAVAPATAVAYIELTGNAVRRAYVRELSMFLNTAIAAPATGLGRPAAKGVTPAGQQLFQAQDPANAAGVTNWSTTFGTAPTVPATFLRRFDLAGTVGSGVIFTWPADGELVIPSTTGVSALVFWNASAGTGPAADFYGVLGE